MTQTEYTQKRSECWEEFKRENLDGEVQWQPVSRYDVFCDAFDRAYTLGKQEIKQEIKQETDAEGEGDEMLYVSRKKVQEIYRQNKEEINRENVSSSNKDCYETVNEVLKTLFGSKCLPDIEPKPDGPKYKVGDKVRISCAFSSGEIWDSVLNGRVATIVGCYRESNNWIYCFEEPIRDFAEFWLEPCTEQETLHCPSSETECCIPVRVPKMDEQRLYIATHITAAIYANYDVAKCFESIEAIVQKAVETADALIARCKKE